MTLEKTSPIEDDSLTHPCRVVLLGAAKSGKSSLVSQFAFHDYFEEYVPTSLDTVCCPTVVDDISYDVKLTDCCADACFAPQRETYLRNADVVLLVYSVTDMDSLEFLRNTIRQARDAQMYTRKGFFPVFVVGTHADVPSSQRKVSRARGEEVAREMCLAHAELVRPLFLRASRPYPESTVQDRVRAVTDSVWGPARCASHVANAHVSPPCSPPTTPPQSQLLTSTDGSDKFPPGASSTIPFMELSTRDSMAVSTLFDAVVRLHAISSTFHDLYMPVKTAAITSPITRSVMCFPPKLVVDKHSGHPPVSFASAPLSTNPPAALASASTTQSHQRTLSTASSCAVAGTNAAVMKMGMSMNCLPCTQYLFGVQSSPASLTVELPICDESNAGGNRSGKSSLHHGQAYVCAVLTPRTPPSSSFVSCASNKGNNSSQNNASRSSNSNNIACTHLRDPHAEMDGKLHDRTKHLSQSPSSFSDTTDLHARSGSCLPSPNTPTLVASTKLPVERRRQKNSSTLLTPCTKSPFVTPTSSASVAPLTLRPEQSPGSQPLLSLSTSPGERRITHSRAESGASRQSRSSKSTLARSPCRKEKPQKDSKDKKEKCVVM